VQLAPSVPVPIGVPVQTGRGSLDVAMQQRPLPVRQRMADHRGRVPPAKAVPIEL
jgi:hypothetical protein